jgi:chromate transporter
MEKKHTKPSFREASLFWFRLGWISFGGPAGQIALLHESVVHRKKWVSNERFMHALSYCMLLPGPEAQQMVTYTGWMLHGARGGILAGVFFILPAVFIMALLSVAYVHYGTTWWMSALFTGIQPAVLAVIVVSMVNLFSKALQNMLQKTLALVAFLLLFFINWPFPVILLCTICFTIILSQVRPQWLIASPTNGIQQGLPDIETSGSSDRGGRNKAFIKTLVVFFLCWTIPFLLITNFADSSGFWQQLIFFFSNTAFITFGGAYAVLPHVAAVTVDDFQWLSSSEMIDGLALGETTPGPLIMVLSFVGFLAANKLSGAGIAGGLVGLVLTTWYTFLPSFLFILAGAPFVERSIGYHKIKRALSCISSVSFACMIQLTVYFAQRVLFIGPPGPVSIQLPAFIWFAVSFIVLFRYKHLLVQWIVFSALVGLVYTWMA